MIFKLKNRDAYALFLKLYHSRFKHCLVKDKIGVLLLAFIYALRLSFCVTLLDVEAQCSSFLSSFRGSRVTFWLSAAIARGVTITFAVERLSCSEVFEKEAER